MTEFDFTDLEASEKLAGWDRDGAAAAPTSWSTTGAQQAFFRKEAQRRMEKAADRSGGGGEVVQDNRRAIDVQGPALPFRIRTAKIYCNGVGKDVCFSQASPSSRDQSELYLCEV